MRILSLFCFVVSLFAMSCYTQKNTANKYLLNVRDTVITDSLGIPKIFIRKNDRLSIQIYSTAIGSRPEVDAPYNLVETGVNAGGFVVDSEGNIEYPQLGKIHVEGLTREDLANLIKQKLSTQLTEPSVIIRFLNFKITVLGEVNSPSTYTLPQEQVNILEALGLAGDLTQFGRKDNIKIIRENDGQREIGSIDLTSSNLFNSPYYRLKQNDIILVEETKRKIRQQEESNVVAKIAIATSIITSIALILNLFQN